MGLASTTRIAHSSQSKGLALDFLESSYQMETYSRADPKVTAPATTPGNKDFDLIPGPVLSNDYKEDMNNRAKARANWLKLAHLSAAMMTLLALAKAGVADPEVLAVDVSSIGTLEVSTGADEDTDWERHRQLESYRPYSLMLRFRNLQLYLQHDRH